MPRGTPRTFQPMKKILFLSLFLNLVGAAVATPDEASLRKAVSDHGADFAYRFTSWSSAEAGDVFSITFLFFNQKKDGKYFAHEGGLPIPDKVEVEITVTHKGKLTPTRKNLNGKDADEMLCRFGYSGFFATDSNDAIRDIYDGHGLVGEKLVKNNYLSRTRKYEEHLSCEWLYRYFEGYIRKS